MTPPVVLSALRWARYPNPQITAFCNVFSDIRKVGLTALTGPDGPNLISITPFEAVCDSSLQGDNRALLSCQGLDTVNDESVTTGQVTH